ncbi:MAG: aldehyde dehydrogenase family protein [Nitrospinae bacterium]|nr:aldehyde dehydrogenase family protein [Nitrospinota bacterium]
MANEHPILAGGRRVRTTDEMAVKNPYDGSTVAVTYLAGDAEAEASTAAAAESFAATRKMTAAERADALHRVSSQISQRAEELARLISKEAGKPITSSRQEVQRSIFTFQYAAEEARRLHGEIIPLDAQPLGRGHVCLVRRFPIGPVLGITPFNFPLNLVAHKVAPAMAAGNPIVVKPAPQTPLTALLLGEIVSDSGWPAGAISVIPAPNGVAERMVADDRYKFFSFTGSAAVGWRLKKTAGRKKTALELGGNSGAVVHHDANLPYAAERIALGGFGYAGQSCISVQRVFVHESVYDEFKRLFLERVATVRAGDPMDESVLVGPLISNRDALRLGDWLKEALGGGARLLCGGAFNGPVMEPTVLENTKPEMKVNCLEVFGPLVTLTPYADAEEALKAVNDSEFGLQAGIFTNDLGLAFRAWETLDVGGVIVGNAPTFRMDHMPYGGTKASGQGREGLRYAMEEMTEPKSMVINLP